MHILPDLTYQTIVEVKNNRFQSWYAQLSDQKKTEYILNGVNHAEVSHKQCTPLSNVTMAHTNSFSCLAGYVQTQAGKVCAQFSPERMVRTSNILNY
jgi:hypothetical protein